ncbi:hypothetical protein GF351_03970, partial [Candidatus Woesearchaeota archaeon]|nr:hypothetical protein [Candidatus Woesearchaeota archaeon]
LTEEETTRGKYFAKTNAIKDDDLVIGLNTGAGKRWEKKRWSEKKTAKLAEKLEKELKARIILLGGPEEKERNAMIMEQSSAKLIDAGTDNSLRDFASKISLCDAVVTSDSLAMHIAIALKKETVVLFGPTSYSEIELYGRGMKIIPKMDCLCCYRNTCSMSPNCMDSIEVDQVFSAVKELVYSKAADKEKGSQDKEKDAPSISESKGSMNRSGAAD